MARGSVCLWRDWVKSADAFTRKVCWGHHPMVNFPPTWLEKEMQIPYIPTYLWLSSGNAVSPGAARGPTFPPATSLVGALHRRHGVVLAALTAALLYSSSVSLLRGGAISSQWMLLNIEGRGQIFGKAVGFALLHHSGLSDTLAQLMHYPGRRFQGGKIFFASSVPVACLFYVSPNQPSMYWRENISFSGLTLRESRRVLDLCVWVGDLSLQGLTPKGGRTGWSWQEMRNVKWREEANAGTYTKSQYW